MKATTKSGETAGDVDSPGSTRGRILDAALNIFSNKGYHATKLDEIVESARTSKGAIYLYFPNKEQLFLALVEEQGIELANELH